MAPENNTIAICLGDPVNLHKIIEIPENFAALKNLCYEFAERYDFFVKSNSQIWYRMIGDDQKAVIVESDEDFRLAM